MFASPETLERHYIVIFLGDKILGTFDAMQVNSTTNTYEGLLTGSVLFISFDDRNLDVSVVFTLLIILFCLYS